MTEVYVVCIYVSVCTSFVYVSCRSSFPLTTPSASPTGDEPCAQSVTYPAVVVVTLLSLVAPSHPSPSSLSLLDLLSPRHGESRSGYAHVPILTKDNFPRWQLSDRVFPTSKSRTAMCVLLSP